MAKKVVTLKRKTDGKTFNVISGYIISANKLTKDVDGSFLTLQSTDNPEETVLYIWPYWAEPEYEIINLEEQ